MNEHNLPDKDDAPWLYSDYDGFMTHEEMLEWSEFNPGSELLEKVKKML